MRTFAVLSLPLLLLLSSCTTSPTTTVLSPDEAREVLARQSVFAWIALTDAGNYAESWNQAAQGFRSAVGTDQWIAAMKSVRDPLGAVKTRELRSANYATSLPGAPDGDYFVMTLDTSFQNKANAVETVTTTLDPDGVWHVAGYFIK